MLIPEITSRTFPINAFLEIMFLRFIEDCFALEELTFKTLQYLLADFILSFRLVRNKLPIKMDFSC